MVPKIHEIYQVLPNYRGCKDERPAVIISPPLANLVTVAYITGQMDSYQPGSHFLIDDTSKDFKSTGLKKRCYVDGNEIAELDLKRVLRKRGELTGQMLVEFKRWI